MSSADSQRPPAVDPDAEQEVDFGRYWRAIAARWWLPVAGLVIGLVVGYLVSLGTNSTNYKATALVYLGQPLAPDERGARLELADDARARLEPGRRARRTSARSRGRSASRPGA